jgi:hypothetical protein
MEVSLEQQLIQQSPFAILFGSMVLLGSLVNRNATESTVTPSQTWCTNTTQIQELISSMPTGLGIATIVVTIIFPIVPMMINSHTKMWSDFKINMLKCHIVGQGSVFGVSELLRHFITMPEPLFLQKCNISTDDCLLKSHVQNIPLLDPQSSESFCNTGTATSLFDSLHHFPDNICCLIGASIVTFLATLYFWNRINKKGKSVYDAHSFQQCFVIIVQILSVTLVFTYIFFLYKTFDNVQMYGIVIGGLIQLMIVCSTLPKKEIYEIV